MCLTLGIVKLHRLLNNLLYTYVILFVKYWWSISIQYFDIVYYM